MKFYENDTITAISTPFGEGGIGIVRISGKSALKIAEQMFIKRNRERVEIKDLQSHYLYYGFVLNPFGKEILDETMMAIMRNPNSYTKEDIVEFSCHGGMLSLRKVLDTVIKFGARMAEPGEFTKRAFLNGRIDLSQAEAVIDLIQAKTDKSLRSSVVRLEGKLKKKIDLLRSKIINIISEIEAPIDFPDQEIRELEDDQIKKRIKDILKEIDVLIDTLNYGKILKEGINTVIVGKTNVGKSSLFNVLINENRAIVASLPGTTRDVIEEAININGVVFKIIDTAGLKNPENVVEKISLSKMKKVLKEADLVLALFDVNTPLSRDDIDVINEVNEAIIRNQKVLIIENKIDLAEKIEHQKVFELLKIKKRIRISLKKGIGIKELEKKLCEKVFDGLVIPENGIMINNLRHSESLLGAKKGLENVLKGINRKIEHDFLTIDLKDALDQLSKITGDVVTDEIIHDIFSRFCIGK